MELEKNLSTLFLLSSGIQGPQIKAAFIILFNIIEQLASRNKMFVEENQQLRDEINRLNGEHGKPDIKPNNRTDSGKVKIRL
jgi:cell division protein FtsB